MSCDFEAGTDPTDFEYEDWAVYQERDVATTTEEDSLTWPTPSQGSLKDKFAFR